MAAALVVLLLTTMSTVFRKPGVRPWPGRVPGAGHALAHGLVAFAAIGFSDLLSPLRDGSDELWAAGLPFWGSLFALLLVAAYCLVFGNAVFAGYFLVCDVVGFHENEFFSAMHVEDYKSHLRLTIEPPLPGHRAGALRVDVLGITSVPKQGTTPDPASVHVELIESFPV